MLNVQRPRRIDALFAVALTACASAPPSANRPSEHAVFRPAAPSAIPVRFASAGELPLGATELHQLGLVVGAQYREDLGKLFLVGNGLDGDVSPSEHQIAFALRRVAGERVRPFVSIDPQSVQRPDASSCVVASLGSGQLDPSDMIVATSPDACASEFGWIMFEADRRLKSYALGRDSVTGQPLTFSVPGFRNTVQLSYAQGQRNAAPGWQRFWLHPAQEDRVVVDAGVMRIERSGIAVSTEADDTIERTAGAATQDDPLAQEFAGFVTRNYGALAGEERSFRRLDQLERLLLVAEWARVRSVPVSLDWVSRHAGLEFVMPHSTPELKVGFAGEQTRHEPVVGGTVVRRTRWEMGARGGASFQELQVRLVPADAGSSEWVPPDLAETLGVGQAARFARGGQVLVAYAIGAGANAGVARRLETLARIPLSADSVELSVRAAQLADYPARIGKDRVLALPRLHLGFPEDDPRGQMGVAGKPDTAVPVRSYELYGADGSLLGAFREHEIDQRAARIAALPVEARSSLRVYAFVESHALVVGLPDGVEQTFAFPSGLLVAERRSSQVIRYEYGRRGALRRIVAEQAGREQVLAEIELDAREQVGLSAVVSGSHKRLPLIAADELPPSRIRPELRATQLPDWELAAIERDARQGPVLVPMGGLTALVTADRVALIQASILDPQALLLAARNTLPAGAKGALVDVQPTHGGDVAVLFDLNGAYALDELSPWGPRARLIGENALRRYHDVMADRVHDAARHGHEFVYFTQDAATLRLWIGKLALEVPLSADALPEQRRIALEQALARISSQLRGPVMLLHQPLELDWGRREVLTQLAAGLRALGKQVYLARDIDLAIKNLARQRVVRWSREVTLSVLDNFKSAKWLETNARAGLARSAKAGAVKDGMQVTMRAPAELDAGPGLTGDGRASHILMLIAHNDERLAELRQALATQRKLDNRTVLSIACGAADSGRAQSELLMRSTAASILTFLDDIQPSVLSVVINGLIEVARTTPAAQLGPEELLTRAIERAEAATLVNDHATILELKKMKQGLFQISRLYTSRRFHNYG